MSFSGGQRTDNIFMDEIATAIREGSSLTLRYRNVETQKLADINNLYTKNSKPNTSKEAESLLDLAVKFKNIGAIKFLLTRNIALPENPAAIANILQSLFINHTVTDRSGAFKDIYLLLKNKFGFDDNTLKKHLNNLFINAARAASSQGMQAMLDMNLVSDVNHVDSAGHTALFYLTRNRIDFLGRLGNGTEMKESKIELEVVQLGAVLNKADILGLQVQDTATKLILSLSKNDKSEINKGVAAVLENDNVITLEQFKSCLNAAINHNQKDAVTSLLTSHHGKDFGIFDADYRPAEIVNKEMADTLIASSIERDNLAKVDSSIEVKINSLSHRIGLSGTLRNDAEEIKLEGSSIDKSLQELSRSLQQYTKSHPEYADMNEAATYTAYASQLKSNSLFSQLMLERVNQGLPTILTTGWPRHAIGVGIQRDSVNGQTYLCLSNRGRGGMDCCLTDEAKKTENLSKYGTVIYQLSKPLSEEFFTDFCCFERDKFQTPEQFNKALQTFLGDAKMLAVIPAGPQSHGTCSYVNTKRTCEGLSFIQSIMRGSKPDNAAEQARVRARYKIYSAEDKRMAYDDVLKLYKELNANPQDNSLEADRVWMDKFIVSIFIQRGTFGADQENLGNLYKQLPESLQAVIPKMYKPSNELNVIKNTSVKSFGVFQPKIKTESYKPIPITGEPLLLKQHEDKLDALKSFLKDKKIDGSKIRKIVVGENQLNIFTVDDRSVKTNLRVELFEKELKADIKNVEQKYEFIIQSFAQLEIPGIINKASFRS